MDRIAWLRAKEDTDLGWLITKGYRTLVILVALLSLSITYLAWRRPDMTTVLSYSFNPLFAAAAINTIITLVVIYLGLAQKRENDKAKESLDNLINRCENKELDSLIKPIYLAFDKYPADPNILTREKFGLSMLSSLMSHPSNRSDTYLYIEKADYVIDIFQQHGNLAQPELRELIRQYLEFRGRHKEKRISSRDEYFIKTATIVEQIESLVKERYEVLMWGKEGD